MPATIRDVFLQFNPLKPLETNDPRYVNCHQERGLPALFEQLRLPLLDTARPFLFSGYLGDGKTTILKQLQGLLTHDERDIVAFGEADERLDLSDVEYDDVLLALLAVVDQTLRERFGADVEAQPFRRVWEDLCRIAHLPVELTKMEVPLGPFGKLTATVKDSPDVRLQIRQGLRQARGPTFLEMVNQYLQQAQEIVCHYGHRQLVVILDNLDRIQETLLPGNVYADERLFLGQATSLLGVQCHVIYTIRLALVHAQAPNLGARYGQVPLIIPMIQVRQADGTPHEAGMARLREIIGRRLRAARTDFDGAFDALSTVDRLCDASGGYLRDLMTLVQSACAEGLAAHGGLPLTATDAAAAMRNLGAQRRMVATDHTAVLEQVSRTHRLDGVPLDIRHALLRQHLV
jgi:hypothetical protein